MKQQDHFTGPPMGWNSWYCFSEGVSDARIRETAAAIKERGLADCGWQYVNIDDCWQGKRGGKYNALQGNERFPDMADLGRYIHSLGLKYGLYSTPFIGTYAGFRGGSSNHTEEQVCIPPGKRAQPEQLYGTYPGGRERGVWTVGKEWLFDNDVRQWCDWEVDFVKVDWNPIDLPTAKRVSDSLRNSGRNIVLSLSNHAALENAGELAGLASLWRISSDITDSWKSICGIALEQAPKWAGYASPGHYNDLDMLQIGAIGKPGTMNPFYTKTRLTLAEQRSQFALWCMYSAPLLLSCDIAGMDEETFLLTTNRELIAIDQDPLTAPPVVLESERSFHVLRKALSGGKHAICIVNLSDEGKKPDFLRWTEPCDVGREIFSRGLPCAGKFTLPPHGCAVFL